MTRRRILPSLLALVLPCLFAPPASGQDRAIDVATVGENADQHTAVPLAAGGLAAAWMQLDAGAGLEVYVRSFAADGQPRTPALRANQRSSGDQQQPSLAPLAQGGFAVAWNSHGQDGSGWGLYLRRFGADGQPLGPEQLASAPRAGDQTGAIHALPNGGFVAAWISPDPQGKRLLVRRYSLNGVSSGRAVPLRTFAAGETFHQVAAGPADNLLVVWKVQRRTPCGWRAQRFGPDGQPRGASFGICALQPPRISAGPKGYVAVWDGWGIWGRRYSPAGQPLGPTFTVDEWYAYLGSVPAGEPRVEQTPGGAFVVVWSTFPCLVDCEADSNDVAYRIYGPGGAAWTHQGRLFPAAFVCKPGDWAPRIAAGPEGRLAVSWLHACAEEGDERPTIRATLLSPAAPEIPPVPPRVAFSDLLAGANEEDGEAVVRVQRTGVAQGPVSVEYFTSPGTAAAEADYLSVSGTLSWAAEDLAERTLRIPLVADGLPEPPEAFSVLLRNPTGGLEASGNPVQVHIDHPGFVGFRAEELPVAEDAGGIKIWVDRRAGRRGAVSARFGTGPSPDHQAPDGLAEPGADYVSAAGRLQWPDGDAAPRSFVVPVLDDSEIEDMEGLAVWLTDLTGGALSGSSPQGAFSWVTIQDDELSWAPGRLEFAAPALEARESAGTLRIPVRRRGGLGGTVSVRYHTLEGSADAEWDFTEAAGVLTWGDSDLADRFIRVPLVNDVHAEGDETLDVALWDPRGGAGLGQVSWLRITIHDDDGPSAP